MKKISAFLVSFLIFLVLLAPASFSLEENGGEEPLSEPLPESPPAPPEQAPGSPEEGDYIPPPEMPPEEEPPFEEPPFEEPLTEVFGEEPIPEGCTAVQTGTGLSQMECDFEKEDFQEFNVKEEIEECNGKFELIDGTPTCIKAGKEGFVGTTCPTQAELDSIKTSCSGKIEEFIDGSGCSAVMCINEGFKEEFDEKIDEKYGSDPLKAEAIKCQKDGGNFTLVKGEPRCMGKSMEPIAVKETLGTIAPQDVTSASAKLDKLGQGLENMEKKLEPIKEKYLEEGKTEELKAIEYSIEKLGDVGSKINEIKSNLSFENMATEQRKEILIEIQDLQREVSKVSKAITQGKVPTMEEMENAVAEQFDQFYGSPFGSKEEFEAFIEAEKSAIELVRSCNKYSAENVKSFVPPDPEGIITEVKLYLDSEGKCRMALHSKNGESAEYLLSESDYQDFKGPRVLPGLPCSGDCSSVNKVFSKRHGETPEELCMEDCVIEGCDGGPFECMELNKEKCELDCGMVKEGEGPFGPKGQLDPMQACVMVCIGDLVDRCEPGGTNPVCNECEEKCVDAYGPGIGYEKCLSGKQLDEKENACIAQGMYGETVEEFVVDKMCIVDVICKEYSPDEWGDDPGTGPDSWEPGHGPGEGQGPPTGETALPYRGSNPINDLMNWLRGWFE